MTMRMRRNQRRSVLLVSVRRRRIVGGRSGRGARRSALGGARRLFLGSRRFEGGGFGGRRWAGGFLLGRRLGLGGQRIGSFFRQTELAKARGVEQLGAFPRLVFPHGLFFVTRPLRFCRRQCRALLGIFGIRRHLHLLGRQVSAQKHGPRGPVTARKPRVVELKYRPTSYGADGGRFQGPRARGREGLACGVSRSNLVDWRE